MVTESRTSQQSRMSLRNLPGLGEARLYLSEHGLRRTLAKFVGCYIAGRQTWYLTRESLGPSISQVIAGDAGSHVVVRSATLDDVPRMGLFTRHVPPSVLRAWCGRDYFFSVAWMDGQAVSYRCLSTLVHPGVADFLRLRPGQLFMVDEYTDPAYRRRGITRAVAAAMTPMLRARGFREVLGIHRTDNHDTIEAARAKGIPRIGVVVRHCLLWKTWFEYVPTAEPTLSAGLDRAIAGGEGVEMAESLLHGIRARRKLA